MVDRIYDIKNQVIDRIDRDIQERGVERMDVTEVGKMVDMVKDLAEAEKACWEAEYYRSVTEAMEGQSGYSAPMAGYSGRGGYDGGSSGGRSGWQNQYGRGRGGSGGSRRGYHDGTAGRTDMVESVRMAMQGMDHAERERMKEQIRTAIEAM